MAQKSQVVDQYIQGYLKKQENHDSAEILELLNSMDYSLTNGGKRFRPVLSLLVGELFSIDPQQVLPFAMATEMIHTYSLIHDDLPCMDDDDERRGKPTNHKVFGEDIALIAGDGLLTEAFYVLADAYQDRPELAQKLTLALSKAAGHRGMVGGQAIDLKAQKEGIDQNSLTLLHRLKTGALIEVSAFGASLIAEASSEESQRLKEFGAKLGLAFQVADDILDFDESQPEKGNFATVIGLEKTRSYLDELSLQSIDCLKSWPDQSQSLKDIVHFNQTRLL